MRASTAAGPLHDFYQALLAKGRKPTLAWIIQCAVKRCWSTVGESPTRELVRSTR
jgi:hypothetical protein